MNDRAIIIKFYNSSLGKKIITGVTGLGLSLFVLFHMTGNLVLLTDSEAYNQLAHFLNSLGILLYLVEFILLGLVVFHVAIAISIQINKQQARPLNYEQITSIGNPSKQSISSRTMIFTGLILLVFLVFHLLTFKFGTYYSTVINGVEMRDLARLVIEKFQSPVYTFSYVGVMIFLGFHLRHGVWSAFQSIGAMNARFSPLIYTFALILAVLISGGFLVLPLAIYGGIIG
ncbi:MAG: succinate dehydrogenase cytochrome b subunit [Xenococcaceae cyanobacterium MO_188.B32]|nr:succinate dehydrogenase cytochrome b subunit [Xenococcaceae cyanobacterium MO_188.B32]